MDPFHSKGGTKALGGQTEGFLEGIEPQITELLLALGCAPSYEEPATTLTRSLRGVSRRRYTLKGDPRGAKFEDHATLSPTSFPPARRSWRRRREPGPRRGRFSSTGTR